MNFILISEVIRWKPKLKLNEILNKFLLQVIKKEIGIHRYSYTSLLVLFYKRFYEIMFSPVWSNTFCHLLGKSDSTLIKFLILTGKKLVQVGFGVLIWGEVAKSGEYSVCGSTSHSSCNSFWWVIKLVGVSHYSGGTLHLIYWPILISFLWVHHLICPTDCNKLQN